MEITSKQRQSGCGAAGSALPWGGRGRKFKSCHSDQKSEVQPNLRFSFIFSQILLKSRVFAIYIMGLFFPILRIEQAHFSPLTTCLTTCRDFGLIFECYYWIIVDSSDNSYQLIYLTTPFCYFRTSPHFLLSICTIDALHPTIAA